MDNYEYCAQFAHDNSHRAARVLDYGCGAGQIVDKLRKSGVEAFGCDVFFEGGDYSGQVTDGALNTIIQPMEDDRIPFPSNHFDLVINNQVMEHVPDLDAVLAEIRRVLKPGGQVLSLFPDRSVWREGHCGIPFLHWFPKHSGVRIYYALMLRAFGLGHHKEGKSRYQWSSEFCDWIDRWTYYRSYSEIERGYRKYFSELKHLEVQRWDKRFNETHFARRWLPTTLKRILHRKLAGMVIVCTRTE